MWNKFVVWFALEIIESAAYLGSKWLCGWSARHCWYSSEIIQRGNSQKPPVGPPWPSSCMRTSHCWQCQESALVPDAWRALFARAVPCFSVACGSVEDFLCRIWTCTCGLWYQQPLVLRRARALQVGWNDCPAETASCLCTRCLWCLYIQFTHKLSYYEQVFFSFTWDNYISSPWICPESILCGVWVRLAWVLV